ncbi:hypothetical protein SK128_005683 [Halocaridina rubra]|uniref:Ionotropic glutamate receptor L-glutamate and glycine-binding domain-containing protein n=1 Tax=Halocaridina rubra TaxID=373956 RepID=A0AAN8ZZ31_HALRR
MKLKLIYQLMVFLNLVKTALLSKQEGKSDNIHLQETSLPLPDASPVEAMQPVGGSTDSTLHYRPSTMNGIENISDWAQYPGETSTLIPLVKCKKPYDKCVLRKDVATAHTSRVNIPLPPAEAEDGGLNVSDMVWQALREHVVKCRFVVITADPQKSFINRVIRISAIETRSLIMVDISKMDPEELSELAQTLLGITTTTCRTLLVDLTAGHGDAIFMLLESAKLYRYPKSRIVIVGSKNHEERVLKDHVFRNSLGILFLSIPKSLLAKLDYQDTKMTWMKPRETTNNETLKDQLDNLRGHLLRVVGNPAFPHNDYIKEENGSQEKVIWLDSLDKRMYATFSHTLNFTYDFRPPADGQWGIYIGNGNWSGLVGAIQHDSADITTIIAPNPGRNKIFDHMRAYTVDPFTVVSLKPQFLSQYTMILRPFNVDVWIGISSVIFLWGFIYWIFRKINSYTSGSPALTLTTSLLNSWSIVMDRTYCGSPLNTSCQVLLLTWLIACIVMTTGYTSSLASHLTVQRRSEPIDTWDDILKQTNWEWGISSRLLTGVPYLYMKESRNPNIMKIFKYLGSLSIEDGLRRVLEGGYTFIVQKSLINMLVASYYTDEFGRTPYYVGRQGQVITSDFGWGIRKGAPYRDKIQYLMNRLLETGLTDYWLEDIKAKRVIENRRRATPEQQYWREDYIISQQQAFENEGKKVLRMKHMLGVFFAMFLGYGFAFLVFLGETLRIGCDIKRCRMQ